MRWYSYICHIMVTEPQRNPGGRGGTRTSSRIRVAALGVQYSYSYQYPNSTGVVRASHAVIYSTAHHLARPAAL